MSERHPQATPVAFRVLESKREADSSEWMTSAEQTDVRPIDFGARRGGGTERGAGGGLPWQAGKESPPANVSFARGSVPPRPSSAASGAPLPNAPALGAPTSVVTAPAVGGPVVQEPVLNGPVAAPTAGAAPGVSEASPPGRNANDSGTVVLTEAASALAVARSELLAHAEGELIDLAVEIARSILGVELETRPELHRSLVRAGLDVLGAEATPRVRVSPESFDAILTTTGSRAVESHGQRVELESDPSIRGAGALLDAGSASVDARLETRLERVRDALQAARRSGAIGEAA
jgi:flagellar assembly protein FliH